MIHPKYICKVCIRLLYRNQVKKCKEERYFEKDSDKLNEIAEKCFTATMSHICNVNEFPQNWYMKLLNEDRNWICHTCDRYLRQESMPPQVQANNLFLTPVPTAIKIEYSGETVDSFTNPIHNYYRYQEGNNKE